MTRRIYFFHQEVSQFLFIFHQFNKLFSSKLPNFTAKLAYFNVIITLPLVRNVIRRTKYSMVALYQCAKIAQSLQCNIRPLFALGLLCFYSNLNVFNLSAVLITLSGIV